MFSAHDYGDTHENIINVLINNSSSTFRQLSQTTNTDTPSPSELQVLEEDFFDEHRLLSSIYSPQPYILLSLLLQRHNFDPYQDIFIRLMDLFDKSHDVDMAVCFGRVSLVEDGPVKDTSDISMDSEFHILQESCTLLPEFDLVDTYIPPSAKKQTITKQ